MKAAIIGGGVIGGAWAARFLLNGWDVSLHDPAPDAADKLEAVLANARRSLPMLYERALPEEGRLDLASLDDAVAGADWVQESVPERLEIKHDVIARIEAVAGADTLIASSTSGFKPSELSAKATHPDRVIVAHPFNPVYLLPLVELVGPTAATERAEDILRGIGMSPLIVAKEIDAHIADRFLEAVWREALWLIKDGIATTAEIDDAIRMGFGLRWAQMGLFETYRLAGGEAGMRHFIEQFGPALAWPWTKLMDVPDLTPELIDTIAAQSDAQSGHLSVRELERTRDDNLVAILRALKGQGAAAGQVIAAHEASMTKGITGRPLTTVVRTIPVDWMDYNGHMNESRYGQVWSDGADAVMAHVGADLDYIQQGGSFFTVETHTKFLAEAKAGDAIRCETRVTEGGGKKLRLAHEMIRQADDAVLATCSQLLIHVSLESRRAADPRPDIAAAIETLAKEHSE